VRRFDRHELADGDVLAVDVDANAPARPGINYTWGRVVGRLKKHVETGESVPFFS
jgi:hypothetical protein